jgi:hypothetical protein
MKEANKQARDECLDKMNWNAVTERINSEQKCSSSTERERNTVKENGKHEANRGETPRANLSEVRRQIEWIRTKKIEEAFRRQERTESTMM